MGPRIKSGDDGVLGRGERNTGATSAREAETPLVRTANECAAYRASAAASPMISTSILAVLAAWLSP